tara:strand:- start:5275 stop:8178 length:2904 start_codon:yes stop_codon:yes gene_type:complete
MTNQQFNTHGDWKFTANEIKPNTGNNLQLYSNNDNDELALTLSGGDAIVENSLQGFKYLASHYPSTTPEQILDVTVSRKEQSNRYHELGTTLSSYFIDGVEAPFLTLTPGITYQFNQNHTSNSGHLLQLSTLPTKNESLIIGNGINYVITYSNSTLNKTLSGEEINDEISFINFNLSFNESFSEPNKALRRYTEITIDENEIDNIIYYSCHNHNYMGNALQTNGASASSSGGGGYGTGGSPSYFLRMYLSDEIDVPDTYTSHLKTLHGWTPDYGDYNFSRHMTNHESLPYAVWTAPVDGIYLFTAIAIVVKHDTEGNDANNEEAALVLMRRPAGGTWLDGYYSGFNAHSRTIYNSNGSTSVSHSGQNAIPSLTEQLKLYKGDSIRLMIYNKKLGYQVHPEYPGHSADAASHGTTWTIALLGTDNPLGVNQTNTGYFFRADGTGSTDKLWSDFDGRDSLTLPGASPGINYFYAIDLLRPEIATGFATTSNEDFDNDTATWTCRLDGMYQIHLRVLFKAAHEAELVIVKNAQPGNTPTGETLRLQKAQRRAGESNTVTFKDFAGNFHTGGAVAMERHHSHSDEVRTGTVSTGAIIHHQFRISIHADTLLHLNAGDTLSAIIELTTTTFADTKVFANEGTSFSISRLDDGKPYVHNNFSDGITVSGDTNFLTGITVSGDAEVGTLNQTTPYHLHLGYNGVRPQRSWRSVATQGYQSGTSGRPWDIGADDGILYFHHGKDEILAFRLMTAVLPLSNQSIITDFIEPRKLLTTAASITARHDDDAAVAAQAAANGSYTNEGWDGVLNNFDATHGTLTGLSTGEVGPLPGNPAEDYANYYDPDEGAWVPTIPGVYHNAASVKIAMTDGDANNNRIVFAYLRILRLEKGENPHGFDESKASNRVVAKRTFEMNGPGKMGVMSTNLTLNTFINVGASDNYKYVVSIAINANTYATEAPYVVTDEEHTSWEIFKIA